VYPHFTRSEFLNNQQTALVHHVVNAYTTQVSYSQWEAMTHLSGSLHSGWNMPEKVSVECFWGPSCSP